ncbi:MAG: sigma-70 family RNA polymerase sigma factor [Candidatus Zixiibacteriota bacterium]|nr:MAG: sigma-70 family RNA polymerase sigma factor [candidate division Zixibacteria bacterium]
MSEYSTLVYSVARRHLSDSDAEDCAQQTWLALYKSRHRIKDAARIPTWLASTSYRRAMRILRKKYSVRRAEQNVPDRAGPLTPDEHYTYLRRQATLKRAVESLDKRCRTLLTELFFSQEETRYKELAKKLRIPRNSLGPTRQRCLKKLKKILEEYE